MTDLNDAILDFYETGETAEWERPVDVWMVSNRLHFLDKPPLRFEGAGPRWRFIPLFEGESYVE